LGSVSTVKKSAPKKRSKRSKRSKALLARRNCTKLYGGDKISPPIFSRVPLGALPPKGKPFCRSIVKTGRLRSISHTLSYTNEQACRIPCRIDHIFWFKMVIENLKKRSFARKERFSQKERPRFIHKIDS
jgi:hypothetical protein